MRCVGLTPTAFAYMLKEYRYWGWCAHASQVTPLELIGNEEITGLFRCKTSYFHLIKFTLID